MEIESNYLLKKRTGPRDGSLTSPVGHGPGQVFTNTPPPSSHGNTYNNKSELKTTDEKTSHEIPESSNGSAGHETVASELEHDVDNLSLHNPTRVQSKLLEIDPASVGITSHTDIFIHSGTRLCYGILLVVFSMIENPLFNKILYIVGFKGDRERGTRYLWQAARFKNFNSAIAGIALLGYYNGLVGFCDILPTDPGAGEDLSGYPKAKCEVLLIDMRKRYPESKLWKMEEARMHAYNRNLAAALKILADSSNSNMKQIAVVNMFEMSLTSMFLLDYELCAKCWIQCSELSSWSPTLYAYLTGVAYVELYRNVRESNPTTAAKYKEKATEYIRKGPPLAGRQKVMNRDLPFDIYIVRKVAKWEERAKAWKVDLVDVIGVSPFVEMIFFWGGLKKQDTDLLEKTLDSLKWERVSHAEKFTDDLEETAIHTILNAATTRNLGRLGDAKILLTSHILNHNRHVNLLSLFLHHRKKLIRCRNEFKGHLKDDWICPYAHFEMACLAWNEKDLDGADHEAKVNDCYQWLEKTQKWGEEYVLNSRIAVKVSTALNTVKRHKKIMGM